MELQQVILGIIGSSLVTSLLTTFLSNLWTDRRLRDQWKREKEERLEQWRREQEARKREWKREYRKELLRSNLETVNRAVIATGYQTVAESVPYDQQDKWRSLMYEATQDIITATIPWMGDDKFFELQQELAQAFEDFSDMEAGAGKEQALFKRVRMIAGAMHMRAERLLEETFD